MMNNGQVDSSKMHTYISDIYNVIYFSVSEYNQKRTATLDEVLDSLLGLSGSATGHSRRRRYSTTLTRISKSTNNLENCYASSQSSISPPKSPFPDRIPTDRTSDCTSPQADRVAREEAASKSLEDTAMEFRRVAQELSERIQLLKCEPEVDESKSAKRSDRNAESSGENLESDVLLQQYSCDYSCLNLDVSRCDDQNVERHDMGLVNTESFPYYDDEDIDPLGKLVSPDVEVKIPSAGPGASPPAPEGHAAKSEPTDQPDVVVSCHHPKCKEQASYMQAQRSYKSCHYCYMVYCSRQCRRSHWEKHRKECVFARVSKMCDNTVQKIKSDSKSRAELSKFARAGYLTRGRGVLKLVFSCPELAWHFIDRGWSAILEEPIYVAWRDVLPQEMGAGAYVEVRNMCQRYDPQVKFVLIVVIYVTTQIKGVGLKRTPAAGYEREMLMKCAKMRLSPTTVFWQPNHCDLNSKPILSSPFDAKDLIKGTP